VTLNLLKNNILGLALAGLLLTGGPLTAQTQNPRVALETSKGRIVLELDPANAPLSTDNFLAYVDAGFYAGTVFHRVIRGFMVQGGGFGEDFVKKPTEAPIPNEAKNGLKNARGTIAMARTGDPHSATAQFYLNTVDNVALDYPSQDGWGYAVFGKVIEGMEAVDAIEEVATGRRNGMGDVPREAVVIQSATRIDTPAAQ
jgi:cyclophilin family peptidyl-prolyl cis-trans isomerase